MNLTRFLKCSMLSCYLSVIRASSTGWLFSACMGSGRIQLPCMFPAVRSDQLSIILHVKAPVLLLAGQEIIVFNPV